MARVRKSEILQNHPQSKPDYSVEQILSKQFETYANIFLYSLFLYYISTFTPNSNWTKICLTKYLQIIGWFPFHKKTYLRKTSIKLQNSPAQSRTVYRWKNTDHAMLYTPLLKRSIRHPFDMALLERSYHYRYDDGHPT